MVFKTERLLIKISAILAIINLLSSFIFGFLFDRLSNDPQFTEYLDQAGMRGTEDMLEFSYWLVVILRIITIVILFMMANKLNTSNYKTYGIITIILGVISWGWLLGPISSILLLIAGIMILVNSKKALEETRNR